MCNLKSHDVPECQRNPYIITGYRKPTYSFITSIKSIFQWHCESMNIWTHLFGLLFLIYKHVESPEINKVDSIFYHTYFITAEICLLFSTILHTFCNHILYNNLVSVMDYVGIVILCMGSQICGLHFFLKDFPKLYYTYLPITFIFGLFSIKEIIRGDTRNVAYRCIIFAGLSSAAVICTFHLRYLYGPIYIVNELIYTVCMIYSCYISGMVLYFKSIPERWKPLIFDYIGNSHNIFHILVLAAIRFQINMMNQMIKLV